jgi:hypothetical protein
LDGGVCDVVAAALDPSWRRDLVPAPDPAVAAPVASRDAAFEASQSEAALPAGRGSCRDFLLGRCSRGRSCRFSHGDPSGAGYKRKQRGDDDTPEGGLTAAAEAAESSSPAAEAAVAAAAVAAAAAAAAAVGSSVAVGAAALPSLAALVPDAAIRAALVAAHDLHWVSVQTGGPSARR